MQNTLALVSNNIFTILQHKRNSKYKYNFSYYVKKLLKLMHKQINNKIVRTLIIQKVKITILFT